MRIKNLRGVSEVRLKKNSTPSPWKHRKATSSAIFCATGANRVNFIYDDKVKEKNEKFGQINEILLISYIWQRRRFEGRLEN